MKKTIKTLCFGMSAALMAGIFGACTPKPEVPSDNPGDNPVVTPAEDSYVYYPYSATHESLDRTVRFYSSDGGLDAMLNDYRERHMRDGENRIHSHPVGMGSTAWKEWESMIGSWWDASAENATMSATYATKDLVTAWLRAPKQDNQGYIWTDSGVSVDSWSMGWEFPDYRQGGKGWLFDTDAEGWSAKGGTVSINDSRLNVNANGASAIELESPDFSCPTTVTPFLRMNFYFAPSGGCDIEDLYVYYKTNDNSSWSEGVSFSEFCTTGYEIGTNGASADGYFFPMYLQEEWGWEAESERQITKLKIVLQPKAGSVVNGTLSFDYICTEYDDRQPLNVCNYIIAAKEILSYSQDTLLLAQVLPVARRAMNFLVNQLEGESGLISTAYLAGHYNDGLKAYGTGMGNGYWDVLAFPKVNLYCNISYYNALRAMAYLEGMCEYYGISSGEVFTVNSSLDGTDMYSHDSHTLYRLAELCKQKIQTTFWNESTGRFHVGYLDDRWGDTPQDHGYAMFNEQVIASGIATEEQTKSVMLWLNGERTVKGDISTGEDIYYYEFAPRFNTGEIGSDFYFGYSASFGDNVQNGGTALHLAYYDILAQAAIGKDLAFDRLKVIQSWYEKVQAAGGTGWNFYRKYYDSTSVNVQGGGTSGTIGVDYEFLEAALLISAVPDAFFGLDTASDNTLLVTPRLPASLDFWKIENLTYGGVYYDLSIGKYFAQISGVEGYRENANIAGAKVSFTFKKPSFQFKIYLDDEEITDYRIENDNLIVTVAFRDAKVEIKGV